MISEKMEALGRKRSVIREIFEYAKVRREQIGDENIFDFSLGNPSVPAPESVNKAIKELLDTMDPVVLHGYTSAQGDAGVRKIMAESIKNDTGFCADENLIYMTCGAAASLTITLTAILLDGDEVVVQAPFFPEYRVFTEKAGGKLVVVPCDDTFKLDFVKLEQSITPKTKAMIINSPNNPSGAVISADEMEKLAHLLDKKSKEFGTEIYLISDEPYRKLAYDGVKVAECANYYDRTVICYSFSKALSLPGDRIGYIAVSPKMDNADSLYAAVCGAGRALGFVCAPTLLQFTAARCVYDTADISVYKSNRDMLYRELTADGYTVVHPDGAFYLFVKSLEPDANAFCERAKKYELLLVPSDDFGCEGYIRIAYCTSPDMIKRSLPAFKKLADSYK